ncbi:glycoside hydrolase family 28 protein [Winslowiella iniecta]|uniref:Exo-poly-alpha-D-galacturonosidase n=1 Tax=Winslowiella iniecta TaxID=1560201 RepID=A0A0L7SX73_9GAMM|nr:glycosyl hydrolase family 28 protein [Winslowiella iniecta]KOC87727.1 exo-poly-alpha-D-galacturonosidase [Winslowiella iniecta]KOC93339.1 exo-poly-alpha-D-galacturonosidase [Winslowiella iniecta]
MYTRLALPVMASCLLATAGVASAASSVKFPDKVCDVTHYGAEGHRLQIALNTGSFQKAIDDCAAAGGGTVEVPAGNYLVNPLFLKSNIRLNLAKNATIVASTEVSAYRASQKNKHGEAENKWLPFISIADVSNVAITGEGTIDGQGAVWWERWRENIRATGKKGGTDRPRLIYMTRADNVLVDGVHLTNSPSFHVVMRNSSNIDINNTRITSPWHAPNTDAIDPIDSRNIRITNNYIDCNDDHIAIKAEKPSARYPDGAVDNIYIANNKLLQGRGISIGSETSGGVNNVLVENNEFIGSMYGIRIKTPRGKGGEVKNIVYRNTKMVDVEVPLVFSGYYKAAPIVQAEVDKMVAEGGFTLGEQIYPPDSDAKQPFDAVKTPHFSNITVSNLTSTGNSKAAGFIIGVPEAPLSGFTFENVRIDATQGVRVRNAELKTSGLTLNIKHGPEMILDQGAMID